MFTSWKIHPIGSNYMYKETCFLCAKMTSLEAQLYSISHKSCFFAKMATSLKGKRSYRYDTTHISH